MLSLFPQILFLAPAGTSLLRIAAGISFIYIGYFMWTNSARIANERIPLIGSLSPWLCALSALIFAVIGTALVVGLWVQLVALVGAIGALKGVIFGKRYANIM